MNSLFVYYLIPVVIIWSIYLGAKIIKLRKTRKNRDHAIKSKMTEPASLHPLIDHRLCMGCGSCLAACPEQDSHSVLGLIGGKSYLIAPSYCIGHGACKPACPHSAITLVFGTEKRGLDIPEVSPTFETNVSGIFIAGELGGMGLIRNAIMQGCQAIDSIKKIKQSDNKSILDVFIVGAGPAGFAASLKAMEDKINYITVEQDSLGGTVFQYPRGKLVMTSPVELPTHGKMKFKEVIKEELLKFWVAVEKKSGVKINYREKVESITKTDNCFEIITTRNKYLTRTVLLTIGRRGSPRKLGVPGEDKPKVVYRLIDPSQYIGQHVLVVGGGDSALEAALAISREEGTTVALSYRSDSFSRAKEQNRIWVDEAKEKKRINVLMSSNVKSITDSHVQIDQKGELISIENDVVIVNAGGILPTAFLKSIGITVETKYGTE